MARFLQTDRDITDTVSNLLNFYSLSVTIAVYVLDFKKIKL